MLSQTLARGSGDVLGRITGKVYNRTGATVVKGSLVMIDLLATQSESADLIEGSESSRFANATPCTQASAEEGFPIVVVLDDSVADNGLMNVLYWGKVDYLCLDDDVSTTDIDKGDRISILVSESAIAAQAFVTGGTGSRVLGIALEDAAANSSDTDRLVNASAHLRTGFWTGGIPVLGSTDT